MNTFKVTPESLIENAKDYFLSQDYLRAFNLIRDSFDKNDLSDETISNLLNGYIGYSVDGDDVSFSKDFIDEEYTQEVSEILVVERTLKTINDDVFMVSDFLPFEYNQLAETNDLVSFLKNHKNSFVKKDDIPFKNTLSDRFWQFDDAEYVLIAEKGLYTYQDNTNNLISQVSVVDSDTDTIINRLNEFYL